MIPNHFNDAKILHDNTIRPKRSQILEKLIHPIRFPLFKNGIHRYIYFTAHPVQAAKGPFKLGIGKIGAPDSGIETLKPQVNRIRPLPNGRV
jgi:hypothetical protein